MAEQKSSFLEVSAVSKRYGEQDVQALQAVSLSVLAGEFVAIMGPSGCGKSTLLNLIAGIDRPDSGTIIVDGARLATLNEDQLTLFRRDKIGFVFQFFNLLSTLTVEENVALPLLLSGSLTQKDIGARVERALHEIGLSERKHFFPSQLSGGEMQRIAVARATIHKPVVVLADEPTGDLDTVSGLTVLNLLRTLSRDHGHTVLMATHSQEAASYCNRVIHMKDGQVVEEAVRQ